MSTRVITMEEAMEALEFREKYEKKLEMIENEKKELERRLKILQALGKTERVGNAFIKFTENNGWSVSYERTHRSGFVSVQSLAWGDTIEEAAGKAEPIVNDLKALIEKIKETNAKKE